MAVNYGLNKVRFPAPVRVGAATYGSQTHPGDGTAGMVVARADVARELSGGAGVARLLSVAFARVERARMPKAPVPAARATLRDAWSSRSSRSTTTEPSSIRGLNGAIRPVEVGVRPGEADVFGYPGPHEVGGCLSMIRWVVNTMPCARRICPRSPRTTPAAGWSIRRASSTSKSNSTGRP